MFKKLFFASLVLALVAGLFTFTKPVAAITVSDDEPIAVTTYCYRTVDSSTTGYWADDEFCSIVQIFSTDYASTYKLIWTDTGSFDSWAGVSPDGSGLIGDHVKGTITGGMTLFVYAPGGIKNNLPSHLGYFDFQCDHEGNCANYTSWRSLFFNTSVPGLYVKDLLQWGWTYTTCNKEQTWINQDIGNVGDITGNDGGVCASTDIISWSDTGLYYWTMLDLNVNPYVPGYWASGTKTGVCVGYTHDPVNILNSEWQQKYCGRGANVPADFIWKTMAAHQFKQQVSNLGEYRYIDNDTGLPADPYTWGK